MMHGKRRNPLVKEHFLEGNRQKMCCLLLGFMGIILVANHRWNIDPNPYLSFLTWIGAATIGGMSWSANMRERAAMSGLGPPREEDHGSPGNIH